MPLCLIIDAYSKLSGMVFERLGQLPLVTSRNLGERTRSGAKNPVQRCESVRIHTNSQKRYEAAARTRVLPSRVVEEREVGELEFPAVLSSQEVVIAEEKVNSRPEVLQCSGGSME